MHQPGVPTGETADEYYGMAWTVGEYDGVPAIYHDGQNGNYASQLIMVPAEKLGIVIMINVNGAIVLGGVQQIGGGVMAVMLGKEPQPYAAPEMLPKLIGSAVVPAVVSILWVAWMVFRFVRRQKRGLPARRSALWTLWVVVLPLVLDLDLLAILLFGIPVLWQLPLSGMSVMFPDLFLLVITGVIALIGWGVAGTIWTLRMAKSQS
jgi:hypothetical protein